MSVERTYTIVSVTWNGNTYNRTNGGPLGFTLNHRGNHLLDRTADDVYSPAVIVPEKDIISGFRMRELISTADPGASKSDLVFRLKAAGRPTDAQYDVTVHAMVLVEMSSALQRSVPGEIAFTFAHEHDPSQNVGANYCIGKATVS